MRVYIAVHERDFVLANMGRFRDNVCARLPGPPDLSDPLLDLVAYWREADELACPERFEIEVDETESIGQVLRRATDIARKTGKARSLPDSLQHDDRRYQGIELYDLGANYPELDRSLTVEQAGVSDGDLLVLLIRWSEWRHYSLGPYTNPEMMLANLQLAAQVEREQSLPRLWGALLYTDEDEDVATYVRTHFDSLNELTGSTLQILVCERPSDWTSAKKYWRTILDPPLFRVFSALRWLPWKPYERWRCYEIADSLGVPPDELPCLVLFNGTRTDELLIFPLREATRDYFRTLITAIYRVARQGRLRYDGPQIQIGVGGRPKWWEKYTDADGNPTPQYDADQSAKMAAESLWSRSHPEVAALDEALFKRVQQGYDEIIDALTRICAKENLVSKSITVNGTGIFVEGNAKVDMWNPQFGGANGSDQAAALLTQLLAAIQQSTELPTDVRDGAIQVVQQVQQDFSSSRHGLAKERLVRLGGVVTVAAASAQPVLDAIEKLVHLLS